MYNERNVYITKCKIGDKIFTYDRAVSKNYYKYHKDIIDREYFNNPEIEFLGWGTIYSIDNIIQNSKREIAFFNLVKEK